MTTLLLHNIRSVHNVGSIFRTADAAGVSKIILSGYTPAPVDRFGLPRKDFSKVSLGAEKTIEWQHIKTLRVVIKMLQQRNYYVVAVEQDKKATPLFKFKPPLSGGLTLEHRKIALVLGNEVRGLSKSALKLCDEIVEIPMRGKKESLNVSVAAGIAMYFLQNKIQ
jgi:tRNA G18 (ribose-2'-O)-methylase SpoU